jgi:glutamate-1-semialdehyde 2,1-aminomutase
MERIAPVGPVYQAGTLSGNPLAMAAGLAQLRAVRDTDPYAALERGAGRLLEALGATAAELGVPFTGGALGGMWGFHFAEGPVLRFEDAKERGDPALFRRFFTACLRDGVFIAPSAFEAAFISVSHTEADMDRTIEVMDGALREARA